MGQNINDGGRIMTSSFAPWLGKTVTFRLITGESRVPLRGFILAESPDSVRMRIGNGWEINVYKSMIVAVEQDKEPDTRTISLMRPTSAAVVCS
jgi:hypothetical protein